MHRVREVRRAKSCVRERSKVLSTFVLGRVKLVNKLRVGWIKVATL
jgi:hypothetical protein